jgi:hypothetical protein
MEQLMENEFRLVDESFTDEMWQQLETKNAFAATLRGIRPTELRRPARPSDH